MGTASILTGFYCGTSTTDKVDDGIGDIVLARQLYLTAWPFVVLIAEVEVGATEERSCLDENNEVGHKRVFRGCGNMTAKVA